MKAPQEGGKKYPTEKEIYLKAVGEEKAENKKAGVRVALAKQDRLKNRTD